MTLEKTVITTFTARKKKKTIQEPLVGGLPVSKVRELTQHLDDSPKPDFMDPMYSLWIKLLEFDDKQDERIRDYKNRLSADREVPAEQAQQMYSIGQLEAEDEDYIMIHTKEAMRLFIGRGLDPEGKLARIPGAKKAASALRFLWIASGQDNPYADWALIQAENALNARAIALEASKNEALKSIKALEEKGLHISILKSTDPIKLILGFKSPYGFAVAQLVCEFDAYVRVVKTLQSKDLVSSDEARLMLRAELRPLRAFFEQTLRQHLLLGRPAFQALKRPDFKSRSNDVRKRIAELAVLWPGLPEAILKCEDLPRHARRAKAWPEASEIESGPMGGEPEPVSKEKLI